jgi:hypothetical protein
MNFYPTAGQQLLGLQQQAQSLTVAARAAAIRVTSAAITTLLMLWGVLPTAP